MSVGSNLRPLGAFADSVGGVMGIGPHAPEWTMLVNLRALSDDESPITVSAERVSQAFYCK